MNENLRQSALDLVERAAASGHVGTISLPEEVQGLFEDTGIRMPSWMAELLTAIPLGGLEIGWQAYEPKDDYDGVEWIELSDASGIRSESIECYPGLAILPAGYINIGSCSGGSGDPYFISVDEGDDPPVYQVYHDVGDTAEAILTEGRRCVASSLSLLFQTAIIANPETPR